MTDGYDNFATDASQIYNRIAQLNKNINATIFTFSLGVDASNDVPYGIACKNNGIWSKSDDSLYITAQMSQYYLYYAHLRNESIPVWTEPYDDIDGAGEVLFIIFYFIILLFYFYFIFIFIFDFYFLFLFFIFLFFILFSIISFQKKIIIYYIK